VETRENIFADEDGVESESIDQIKKKHTKTRSFLGSRIKTRQHKVMKTV
jgi:hypothetical protein